jgi:hypothetical protein
MMPVSWNVTPVVSMMGTNVSDENAAAVSRTESSLNRKMQAAGSFQALTPIYKTTRRHISEDSNLDV